MDLADTLGFYRREGLTVDFVRVQGTPLAIVALKTGNADLANISLSGALQLAAQRVMKIKAVVSPDKAIRYLIASHSDVPSIKALEGFTLGIGGVGSLDHSMTRLVLAAHGVDVEKVKMVALGEPHVRALALSTRRIDATTMSVGVVEPVPQPARAEGSAFGRGLLQRSAGAQQGDRGGTGRSRRPATGGRTLRGSPGQSITRVRGRSGRMGRGYAPCPPGCSAA